MAWAATGDFDNDGCIDLYLTNLGSTSSIRNNWTARSRMSRRKRHRRSALGTSAVLDYDRDGWLDLFVVNMSSSP